MEIANKYIVQDIPKTIINHISGEWPRTLVEWNIRRKELESIPQSTHRTFPEPVAAIQFATLHGAPDLLPAAFYQLCITPTTSDWDAALLKEEPAALDLAARWSSLDAENAVRFAKGRDALFRYYFNNVSERISCRLHSSCPFKQSKCREIDSARGCFHHDCLKQLQAFIDQPAAVIEVTYCWGKHEKNLRALQAEIWDKLPDFFELERPTAP